MPVWQKLYEEIGDEKFAIISVAQDTGGEAAAGKIFDDAKVTYTAIIDQDHAVSSLFNLVNVPSGVWIDEQGKIVRINEGTYAAYHKIGKFEFGSDDYVPALRDWIAKGADSQFAWTPEEVKSHIIARSPDAENAEPAFKLAVYFQQTGKSEKANVWWEKAQKLSPENWNFHRQDWSFTPTEAIPNWLKKVQGLGGKPYYRPLDLPGKNGRN